MHEPIGITEAQPALTTPRQDCEISKLPKSIVRFLNSSMHSRVQLSSLSDFRTLRQYCAHCLHPY